MATGGLAVRVARRVPGVPEAGCDAWRERPLSARAVRQAWRTARSRAVHAAARGPRGARRVHAELVLGRGISVGHQAVEHLMRAAGLPGLSGRPRHREAAPHAAATDRVGRPLGREAPGELRATDVTEHPTRAGKASCAVGLDAGSRHVVGWSIDASPTAALVTDAPGLALDARRPAEATVIRSDQGTQDGAWACTRRAPDAGLRPAMGAGGAGLDDAVMEAFWGRVQVERLGRQGWSTRPEPATAPCDSLEILHRRQRRHPSLGMLTPIERDPRQAATATSTPA